MNRFTILDEKLELKELTDKTMELLEIENIEDMSKKLFEVVMTNNTGIYEKFSQIISGDQSIDWMQKIFQYYQADRKEKMQDYTPQSLAKFVGKLAGTSDTVTDMCAGSGALTIQKWNLEHNTKFILYEFDEKVIPFLLFNMAIRNIECIVYHSDVLQQEIFNTYKISRGTRYGIFKEVER